MLMCVGCLFRILVVFFFGSFGMRVSVFECICCQLMLYARIGLLIRVETSDFGLRLGTNFYRGNS